MVDINDGFNRAYSSQYFNFEDDKIEVFTQLKNLFDLHECIKSVKDQEKVKFKKLMDKCANDR